MYTGAQGRKALYDLIIPSHSKALIVFAHGYKGFKDWGTFPLWPQFFAQHNFAFLKFNFSHNGIGLHNMGEFTELDAFAQNRYTYEQDDLSAIFSLIQHHIDIKALPLILMAHSRGGAMAQCFTSSNKTISKLVLMASVSDLSLRFPWNISEWRKDGVVYVENARTGQKMPHNFSFYQDFEKNREKFNLKKQRQAINCPVFIGHGSDDLAVPLWEAEEMAKDLADAKLKIYPDTEHVFGASHPYIKNTLPDALEAFLSDVVTFIRA